MDDNTFISNDLFDLNDEVSVLLWIPNSDNNSIADYSIPRLDSQLWGQKVFSWSSSYIGLKNEHKSSQVSSGGKFFSQIIAFSSGICDWFLCTIGIFSVSSIEWNNRGFNKPLFGWHSTVGFRFNYRYLL